MSGSREFLQRRVVLNGAPLSYKPCLQIVGSPFDANVDVDVGRDGLESYETSTVKFPGKNQWGILIALDIVGR